MRATAILALAVLAVPASAQTANTQCQWIGNIWSCRQGGIALPPPVDQGATMQAGANLIGDYSQKEAERKRLRLQEREIELREREVALEESRGRDTAEPEKDAFLDSVLIHCLDGTDISQLPDDRRVLTSALCYAYERGRASR